MFTAKWLINLFASVFLTMCIIYAIKKVSEKYHIPVVSQVAAEV